MRSLLVVMAFGSSAAADEGSTMVHAELDPLTFANGGYGVMAGVRLPQLHGVRLAIAQFSLHVPDAIAQLGGNDGFDERVRPGSGAIYALYYLRSPGQDGFAVGASVRLLRVAYEHDDVPGASDHITEVSPEAIVAYQWHPLPHALPGFYLQPWLGLGVTVWRTHTAVVGDRRFDELPVNPFLTVNLGYELAL